MKYMYNHLINAFAGTGDSGNTTSAQPWYQQRESKKAAEILSALYLHGRHCIFNFKDKMS